MPHPDKSLISDGNLYHSNHEARVLSMAPGLQSLEIIPFKVAAYDGQSKQMAFFDPQRKADFDFISGSRIPDFSKSGENPREGFMDSRSWQILSAYYQNANLNLEICNAPNGCDPREF